jgi:hypothetical protein
MTISIPIVFWTASTINGYLQLEKLYSRKCQTLGVPRQSRGFTLRANYFLLNSASSSSGLGNNLLSFLGPVCMPHRQKGFCKPDYITGDTDHPMSKHSDIGHSKERHSRETTKTLDSPASSAGQAKSSPE